MDKNNEQKKNTNPETNQKQDNLKPWLKLLPAAAVFAAVCVTCYQTEKSPVETAVVSNNSIMSQLMRFQFSHIAKMRLFILKQTQMVAHTKQ